MLGAVDLLRMKGGALFLWAPEPARPEAHGNEDPSHSASSFPAVEYWLAADSLVGGHCGVDSLTRAGGGVIRTASIATSASRLQLVVT